MDRRRGGRRPLGLEEFEMSRIMEQLRGAGSRMRGNMAAEDIGMEARNSKLGKPVPGLPGVNFSPDMATASRKAAASHSLFHSPNRMSHPAIGFSKGQAGLGQSAIDSVMPRLNEAGIYRDSTGTWQLRGSAGSPGKSDSMGIAAKVKSAIANGPASPQTRVPQIGGNRPAPGTSGTSGTTPLTNLSTNGPVPRRAGTGQQPAQGGDYGPGMQPASGNAPRPAGTSKPSGTFVPPGSGGMPQGRFDPSVQPSGGVNQSKVPGSGVSQAPVSPGLGGGGLPLIQGGQPMNTSGAAPTGSINDARAYMSPEALAAQGANPAWNQPASGGMGPLQQAWMVEEQARIARGMTPSYTIPTEEELQAAGYVPKAEPPAMGGGIRDILMSMAGTAATQPQQQVSGGYLHPDTAAGMMQNGIPASGVGSPQGAIRTDVIGYGTGADWENYNVYDPTFDQYGQQFGVDPAVLKGMMIVESGGAAGTPDNGWGNGVMQVQPEWQAEADRLGLPPVNTDEGQIAMAAAILGGYASLGQPTVKGDWETNFRNIFFPSPVELRTGSGITQDQYVNAVNTLAGDIHAAGGGTGQVVPGDAGTPGIGDVGPGGLPVVGGGQPIPPLGSAPVQGGAMDPAPLPPAGQEGGYFGGNSAAPIVETGMGVVSPGPGGEVSTTTAQPNFNASLVNPDTGYSTPSGGFILQDPNPIPNYDPQFIVYHITDGEGDPSTAGNNLFGGGSTNYVIGRDGTIWTYVEPGSATPLANGAGVINPEKVAAGEYIANGGEMNAGSISVEVIATQGSELTPEQIAAGQQLTAYLSGQYGIPMDDQHVIGHSDVDAEGRGDWDPYSVYDPSIMIPTDMQTTTPAGTSTSLFPGSDRLMGGTQAPIGIAAPGAGTTPAGGIHNTIAVPEPGMMAPSGQPISVDGPESTGWINAIVPGGQGAYLSEGAYGFGDDQGVNMYGDYINWGCPTCHTGTDIPTNGSQPFTSTVEGTVVCANGQGNGAGHVGCQAYGAIDPATGQVKPGQITIQTPDGALITYGHAEQMMVMPGDQVTAGQQLGMSGNLNGYHVHAEVQLPIGEGGSMVLVDPNLYYSGHYCQQGFCPSGGTSPAATGYMGPEALAAMNSGQVTSPSWEGTGGGAMTQMEVEAMSQPQAGLGGYTAYDQQYTAPAAGTSYTAQPDTTGYSYSPQPDTYTTPELYTDEYGRQYEYDPSIGYVLVYDPTTTPVGGGPY